MMNSVPTFSNLFGETVVVVDRQKIKTHFDPLQRMCIWLGYAIDHSVETHQLYAPNTREVILTRDVKF